MLCNVAQCENNVYGVATTVSYVASHPIRVELRTQNHVFASFNLLSAGVNYIRFLLFISTWHINF